MLIKKLKIIKSKKIEISFLSSLFFSVNYDKLSPKKRTEDMSSRKRLGFGLGFLFFGYSGWVFLENSETLLGLEGRGSS